MLNLDKIALCLVQKLYSLSLLQFDEPNAYFKVHASIAHYTATYFLIKEVCSRVMCDV